MKSSLSEPARTLSSCQVAWISSSLLAPLSESEIMLRISPKSLSGATKLLTYVIPTAQRKNPKRYLYCKRQSKLYSSLRRRYERSIAVAKHPVSSLAQRSVTGGGWQDPGLRRRATLLLDPVSSRPSPSDVHLECALDAVRRAEAICQHKGILHGHTTSFAHVWWAGMCSIPDQDHSAAVPLVELDPFNRPNDELFTTPQGSEIRRNRLAKSSKAASEAFEASR